MRKLTSVIVILIILVSMTGIVIYLNQQPEDIPQDGRNNDTIGFNRSSIAVELVEIFPRGAFSMPTGIYFHSTLSDTAWVTELSGKIISVDLETGINSTLLNIRSKIGEITDEEGFVGFTFDPGFESNGYVYLHYTSSDPLSTIISRVTYTNGTINPSTELILFDIEQPYPNHNGGGLVFDENGYLYIGMGDGGLYYDPHRHGQNRSTLLGSILRVDPTPTENANYSIPPTNPYVSNTNGYLEEIFAYGLRNPYKMSIDPVTGKLWVGDVGQDDREEVDIIEPGQNYGWSIYEGSLCIQDESCGSIDQTGPVYEYTHDQGDAIIGGLVYRGSDVPELVGHYIFADWLEGYILNLDPDNGGNTELLKEITFLTSSITANLDNELYFCGFDGSIYRMK